jgi:DHA2 family multidrug resistance protein-like MFS transporter
VAAAATVAGRLAERAPAAWLCAAGASGLALGLAATAALSPQASPALLALLLALCGAGFGLFQTPNNRTLFLAAPLARSGAAGGMQGLARLTGQTAGAILTAGLLARYGPAEGPRAGFLLGAGLCLAAGLVSLRNAGPARRPAPELRTVP